MQCIFSHRVVFEKARKRENVRFRRMDPVVTNNDTLQWMEIFESSYFRIVS